MDKSTIAKKERQEILKKSILKVTEDQQVSWADIKRKVAEGDITYTLALTIAKRKIDGNQNQISWFLR